MAKSDDVVVIGAARTPMGNFGGTLKDFKCYDLGGSVIRGVLEKSNVSPEQIDYVAGGNTRQAGNGPNPARTAALKGGIGIDVHAITINNACPSSMKAAIIASQNILLGDSNAVLVLGMESMSTIPFLIHGIRWSGIRFGDHVITDGWGDATDPICGYAMGVTAENVAEKYGIPREEMDQYALRSHQKAAEAQDNGWFDDEIVPIEIPGSRKKEGFLFSKDESIRRNSTLERMAALKSAFKKDGVVTAGNACGLTDGAAAAIFTSRQKAEELGCKPLFKIVSYASAAVENEVMGEGPGVSIPLALEKAGMSLGDMDIVEINEAFAAQVLANERVLNLDRDKLNVHGGAIALGHPTG
ncbi:MAG: thiolase family protein, partial [bacterium]|nr:thiolase family protein [bacterium]